MELFEYVKAVEITDKEKIKEHLDRSLMLVTALTPKIGYDSAATVAKEALKLNKSLKEVCLEMQLITAEEYDTIVDPKNMV